MAGEPHAVVDALPYYDRGYDEPGVKDAALALVEEELRRYRPTKNYLDFLPPVNYHNFETDVMKSEFERLQSRLPMEMLSIKRYELPAPPAGRMNDVSAWIESVDNAQAQLEHQSLRIANLELMSQFGTDAWRMYNSILEKMLSAAQNQLNDIRKKIQEINWQRKQEQLEAGAKLKQLEESWVGLVGKNYEIERACVELEQDIADLERRKKQ